MSSRTRVVVDRLKRSDSITDNIKPGLPLDNLFRVQTFSEVQTTRHDPCHLYIHSLRFQTFLKLEHSSSPTDLWVHYPLWRSQKQVECEGKAKHSRPIVMWEDVLPGRVRIKHSLIIVGHWLHEGFLSGSPGEGQANKLSFTCQSASFLSLRAT